MQQYNHGRYDEIAPVNTSSLFSNEAYFYVKSVEERTSLLITRCDGKLTNKAEPNTTTQINFSCLITKQPKKPWIYHEKIFSLEKVFINGAFQQGSEYHTIRVYRSAINMVHTELYRTVPSVPIHDILRCTNAPPILILCKTNTYHSYRLVRYGIANHAF